MKEELSRLRYNLNSGEVYIHTVISFYYYQINQQVITNYNVIQLKLKEYYQLLGEAKKVDDYNYFYEYLREVNDEMNKLNNEKRIRHIHHQYQRITTALDIMIPKLKKAIDDYYIHLV